MSSPMYLETLLARNSEYATTHQPIPTVHELLAAGAPLSQTVVITCADPRCHPEDFFKLNMGEVVVIRNAGGDAHNALPTIIGIDSIHPNYQVKEILVVKHTDCGGLEIRDEHVRSLLNKRAPHRSEEVEKMAFLEMTGSLEEAVERDVAWLKGNDLLTAEARANVYGFVYDLGTGKVSRVV